MAIQKLKDLLVKYEKYLSPGAMLLGFVVDSLTLTRADVWLDNLILLSYLLLAGISILLLNAHAAGRVQRISRLIVLLPLAMQFAFGGLFSGFVVLYSRSASLAASWPFIAIMAALLIGNEYFRNRYRRLAFQIGIYFLAIFSYLTFAVPVVLNTIGQLIFLLSGLLSLLVIYFIVRAINAFAPEQIQPFKRTILSAVLIVFAGFNFLYFANIIPPIPLALKDMFVAHQVEHLDSGDFLVTYEKPKWYHFFKDFNPTYHRFGNEPIFVFSAIYAPTDLRTDIIHEWQFFDEKNSHWVTASRLQYAIFGGRQQGFRGFSFKSNVQPGKWRVTVQTKSGQILGRIKFKVIQSSLPTEVITEPK
ncbi:MAG: DUF2914 domain-containing protein [bacterium]|nr:DUF2914 domain-containing protein [bacterium]